MTKWSITQNLATVRQTQVFSGGACNILNEAGELLRNKERDSINDWLTERGVVFFDPQIHPDTHGEEYDFAKHHPLEMAARLFAKINLYEVSPRTFGGITSMEVAYDRFHSLEPMVIYYSDGDANRDSIPAHSDTGHPLFVPDGIHTSEIAINAHYREFIKNGNNMRRYLMRFAREMDKQNLLTVSFTDRPQPGDIVISPDRMHAAQLFKAVVDAASGKRVYVTFTGGPNSRDDKGNPMFMIPDNPPEVEMHAFLDQYVDEGNELRRAIAELIHVNVFVRVVYTQASAKLALEELLRIRGMIE